MHLSSRLSCIKCNMNLTQTLPTQLTTQRQQHQPHIRYTIYKHNLQYTLPKAEALDDWKNKSRDILDITSVNSVSLESCLHIHIYLFFNTLYIDNSLSNAKKSLKLLLHEHVLYPPSTWFIIYNLLNL